VIAFLFPGQGSQKVGMGRALADAFPVARAAFAEADAAFGADAMLTNLIFNGPEDQLTLTEITQPALLATSIAAFRVLDEKGIAPAFVAGHSLGEYSANVAAGTFTFPDAIAIVRRRGRYMQEAVPVGTGAMAAILGSNRETVQRACDEAAQGEVVSPANINSPGQVVIAGHAGAVQRASAAAKALGAKRAVPLAVSAPFHCALMKPAEDRLRARAARPGREGSARADRGQRRCRAETRCGVCNRGPRPAGVGAGALGGCHPPPCVGWRYYVC
jgi:[acyl-carrier-protein] S-malonyltransferase